jgi:excisionase family DNA binding protein
MTDQHPALNPTEWITTKEAAELTGYRSAHIRYLAKEGHIIGRKFGRDWMIDRGGLQAYAEKMKQLGSAKHDPWRTGARQKLAEE